MARFFCARMNSNYLYVYVTRCKQTATCFVVWRALSLGAFCVFATTFAFTHEAILSYIMQRGVSNISARIRRSQFFIENRHPPTPSLDFCQRVPGLGQTSLSLILLLDQCLLAAGLSLCFQHYVERKVKTRADPADQLLAVAPTPRKMHTNKYGKYSPRLFNRQIRNGDVM